MIKENKENDKFIDEFFQFNKSESDGEKCTNQSLKHGHLADLLSSDNSDQDVFIRPINKGKISRRTWLSLILLIIIVPVLLYLSVIYFGGSNYLVTSLILIVAAIIPFLIVFEGRKPKPKEIMVLAVLIAMGVAGRAIFFMVPSFKPVAAIAILAGISLGGEAGFFTGCFTMLVSDMFMGQGPWTPWQMFVYGMIGFVAGLLFKLGILKARRIPLSIYGVLSVIIIFGGIMNPASVLMSYGVLTRESVIAAYISGLPLDIVQAVATVIFLMILAKPVLKKLERVKTKYGLGV